LICEELALRALRAGNSTISTGNVVEILSAALVNVSESVRYSYREMFSEKTGDRDTYSGLVPIVESSSSVRRAIVAAYAVVPAGRYDLAADLALELMRARAEFIPDNLRDLSEIDVEVVLDEVRSLSDFIVRRDQLLEFRDSFARAYAWLEAASRFGEQGISALGRPRG
jgi:hypothetical protein